MGRRRSHTFTTSPPGMSFCAQRRQAGGQIWAPTERARWGKPLYSVGIEEGSPCGHSPTQFHTLQHEASEGPNESPKRAQTRLGMEAVPSSFEWEVKLGANDKHSAGPNSRRNGLSKKRGGIPGCLS